MRTRSILLSGLAVAIMAIGGATAAYFVFLRGDQIAPLTLPSSAPGASSVIGTSAGSSGAGTSLPPASAATIDAASMPGTWSIGADSLVGYRVRERLASLSADSDAVGRTSAISGSATIAASSGSLTLTKATFTVDMTKLASDKQMRDNKLRNQGIETDTYQSSTFTLTESVALPTAATSGAVVDVTLRGDLTLHGVTKSVTIPARAQLSGSQIQVQGALSFPFSDYSITAPNIGGFVSVQDNGTLEFLVNLTKA